ncbi:MAG: ATP-binding protein [Anaerolineae bacterium]|nr:ATP-binding protein [Anaerolineae bacterium]NUQ06895.1 PAS domain-containing protein [Anaerolineae bacterium]
MFSLMLSILLLLLSVTALAGIALAMHYANPRYGISPLLMYTAAIVGLLTYSNTGIVYSEPIPGIVFTIPADVLVPVILMIILILYAVDGTAVARIIIFGIALIQLLIMASAAITRLHAALPTTVITLEAEAFANALKLDPQMMVAGVIAFLADMFVATIVYQGIHNTLRKPHTLVMVGAALLGSLWTDAIVFNLISSVGRGGFVELIPGDIVAKSITALMITPLAAIYLDHFVPRLPTRGVNMRRPTFDIVHNVFGRWYGTIARLEAELRENEMNTREVVRNLPEMLWIAARGDDHAYFVSPAFENILGLSRRQYYLDPQHIDALIHPEDRPAVTDWLTFTERRREIEFRLLRENGEIRWMRDRTYPIDEPGDQFDRVIGITEDVTAQKQRQELILAIERERDKIRLLHDMAREISHDIQSPISAITLKVDLLERVQDRPERQKKYLDDLKRQTEQLGQMLDQFFALLREGSHPGALPDVVMLNDACRDVCREVEALAASKHIALEVSLCDRPTPVRGMPTDVRRVAANLINNAIRYTPPHGRVSVRTQVDDDRVSLIVQDTGIGIAAADLPRIFDRFFRGGNVQQFEGTGLGLAITRQIVERCRGAVEVESVLGAGSQFSVTLPLAEVET